MNRGDVVYQSGDLVKINYEGKECLCYVIGYFEFDKLMLKPVDHPTHIWSLDVHDLDIKKVNPMQYDQLAYNNVNKVSVTKEFTFDSSHFLKNYNGKCANLHGHTYKLHVTFRGTVCNFTGMVIDFSEIKELVNECLLKNLDHRMLNTEFEFNTTAENMVVFIYDYLSLAILNNEDVDVEAVTLWETPTSFATYRG